MVTREEQAWEAFLLHSLHHAGHLEQVGHLEPVTVEKDVVKRSKELLRIVGKQWHSLPSRQCLICGYAPGLKRVELVGALDLAYDRVKQARLNLALEHGVYLPIHLLLVVSHICGKAPDRGPLILPVFL